MESSINGRSLRWPKWVAAVLLLATSGVFAFVLRGALARPTDERDDSGYQTPQFLERKNVDLSGFWVVSNKASKWEGSASLSEIAASWDKVGYRNIAATEQALASGGLDAGSQLEGDLLRVVLHHYEGEPDKAYEILAKMRSPVEADPALAREWLYTIVFSQGVTALRRGENENCIQCRGESSCIVPISASAIHVNPSGSRTAIRHFSEYLKRFPNDLEVRWLLNLAHMTVGEHPQQVDPEQLISLERFQKSEFDIGRFRDVGHLVGVNRLNQAGGCVMEDFDNDGRLDFICTSFDPTMPMVYYHNNGDGTFADRTVASGTSSQLGGLFCCQTDFDNDGWMDVFIPRGAWLPYPMRPTLLRNNGDGTFTDVTQKAGLLDPLNSNSAAWADYDNDGFVDLFICCERQPNRLYRNKGDGTFEEVATKAGLRTRGPMCKGAAWFDYDNDGYPDLFLNYLTALAQLYRNNGDGTFTEVTASNGIDGPRFGFSCWAFDYDNDGWIDVFATSYDRTLKDVVLGLQGKSHTRESNRLLRNMQGKGFKDVTRQVGLDKVFAAMGSNFGDFDNDGYLDFYLGTGDPNLSMLVPNRMFKNVEGKRFAEITGTSGTGHLQKGHGVACGDWNRDGAVDVLIEMGGAVNGDKYHNVLFQNPGQGNNWLTVKLVGVKSNRAAFGARIKAVTDGDNPLTVHRHVSSGSSFGANPLQQHLGLGKAERVAELEITWPTSRTKQVFRNILANQAIEITEFAETYKTLDWQPIPLPKP